MLHVIGEILYDIYQTENNIEKHPGGAPFNVASNVVHFGGDVTFYGAVGDDKLGDSLKSFASSFPFNKLVLDTPKDRHTSEAIVSLNNGERSFRFNRDLGADYVLDVSSLSKLDIKEGDIVHLGSLMLSYKSGYDFFFKTVQYIKERKAKLSFDVNYRSDIFSSKNEAINIFKKALNEADYVKLSNDEINVLTNELDVLKGLKSLLKKNQEAFVSLGKKGSMYYKNDKYIKVPTIKVTPLDTTGAGDAFYSYVLFALDKGLQDKVQILKYANACGASATQKLGAINVVPSLSELEEYFK